MTFEEGLQLATILAKKISTKRDGSAQAQQLVDRWLAESDQNRKVYEELLSGQALKEKQEDLIHYDFAHTMRGVLKKIQARRIRIYLLRGASAAAILLAALFLPHLWNASDNEVEVKTLSQVAPNQIILSVAGYEPVAFDQDEDEDAWRQYVAVDSLVPKEEVMVQVSVPRGSRHQLRLPDGSRVWLNSETVITYNESFEGVGRHLYMSGEAYFEVVPNKEKPFTVTSDWGYRLSVLGTSFNVNTHHEGHVETVLAEGSVGIMAGSDPMQLICPSQMAIFDKNSGAMQIEEVDIAPYVAWKEDRIIFVEKELQYIAETLSRWYNIDIEVKEKAVGKIHFTCSLKRSDDIGAILDAILSGLEISYRIKGGKIIVYRN